MVHAVYYVLFLWTKGDSEDLSFKKGEILTVLRKDEDDWWFAQNENGRQGSIPVPYIQIVSYIETLYIVS